MDVYFKSEARLNPEQYAIIACGRLAGDAALWLRHAGIDLDHITWPELQHQLRSAFKPLNWESRARNQL